MTGTCVVDVAGGTYGGAARFAGELHRYLDGARRDDVRVVGVGERVTVGWLGRREPAARGGTRKVALNNVGFVAPGGQRWTLLRNALHFLTASEARELGTTVSRAVHAQAAVVRLAIRRSDVLVVPCTAMAERVAHAVPAVRDHLVVRPHPVSADSVPAGVVRAPAILCPVVFHPYKHIEQRITALVHALDAIATPEVRLHVTADREQLTPFLAAHPRVHPIGLLSHAELRTCWARSRAVYFPTGLEAFGYPLAEARVSGHPIIALDTAQNREIAGDALCGFSAGDDSLEVAVDRALTVQVRPDPLAFDPTAYFTWLLDPS